MKWYFKAVEKDKESNLYQELIVERNRLDLQFIDQLASVNIPWDFWNGKRTITLVLTSSMLLDVSYRLLHNKKESFLLPSIHCHFVNHGSEWQQQQWQQLLNPQSFR